MDDRIAPQVIVWPLVTRERFAELSGLGEEVVRGLIEKGRLPSIKVGRHRMVNVALITKSCLEQEDWE